MFSTASCEHDHQPCMWYLSVIKWQSKSRPSGLVVSGQSVWIARWIPPLISYYLCPLFTFNSLIVLAIVLVLNYTNYNEKHDYAGVVNARVDGNATIHKMFNNCNAKFDLDDTFTILFSLSSPFCCSSKSNSEECQVIWGISMDGRGRWLGFCQFCTCPNGSELPTLYVSREGWGYQVWVFKPT